MTNTRNLRLESLLFVLVLIGSGAMSSVTKALAFPRQVHDHFKAEEDEKPGDGNRPTEEPVRIGLSNMQSQGNIDSSLRDAAEHFIEAADHGDVATVAATYAPEFVSVRVADEGGFVRMTREQMLAFWKTATSSLPAGQPGPQAIPTQKTTIHYAEALGDTGFVLLTRIKNIGNGWEPMFYNLVWKRDGGNWLLLREFVHQKSIPKQRVK